MNLRGNLRVYPQAGQAMKNRKTRPRIGMPTKARPAKRPSRTELGRSEVGAAGFNKVRSRLTVFEILGLSLRFPLKFMFHGKPSKPVDEEKRWSPWGEVGAARLIPHQ